MCDFMEYKLRSPLSGEPSEIELVRKLKIGDTVYLSGIIYTARDEAHRLALDYARANKPLPVEFKGSAIYHCGPVVKRDVSGNWKIVVAGPTTSARMNKVEPEFIARFNPAFIIGKGGMDKATTEAMAKYSTVYLTYTGGAAVLASQQLTKVHTVYWLEELGIPEALWVLEANNFGPLIVTIDTYGNNFHERIETQVKNQLKKLI